ncbi:hypothetical protein [Streptomyces sp. NBC_01800]|uniref:hypothetical protein n=1 Tax=Streptomyces sp. NBC_01800 TaxID=2975945 RepID=UPI002DDA39A3|nr:hypothetical protein [Streptomyces sp. NBC_01800]WSA65880.1 hypothetical protein OIE65_01940 [Streptomyces sp. NBC_01800]
MQADAAGLEAELDCYAESVRDLWHANRRPRFRAQEQRLQSLSTSRDAAGLWEASAEAGREQFRAVSGRITGRRLTWRD